MTLQPNDTDQTTPSPDQTQSGYWLVTLGIISDVKVRGPLTRDELVTAAKEAAKEPGMVLFVFDGVRIFTSKGPFCHLLLDPPVPLFDVGPLEPDPSGCVNDQPTSQLQSKSSVKSVQREREQAWDK